MAFEALFDASNGTPFKFEDKGTVLEAYYMGSFDYEGDYGPTKKHVFKLEHDDSAVVVFGQRSLMQQLPEARVGAMLRITYTGDKPAAKKGQHPMKLFKIEQDLKNTTNVAGGVKTETTAQDEDTGYSNPSEENGEELDEVEEPQLPRAAAPRTPAGAPNQAAANKVRELLNRGKATRTA